MGYGAPLKNQNKGYAAQEKKDLLKDNPVAKVASGGSWMSKHISSPLAMGKAHSMAPKMHGGPLHNQGEKDKDDESIAGRLGKKGSNISNKDRRDESLGDRGTRTK